MLRLPSGPVDLGDIPVGVTSPRIAVTIVNDGDLATTVKPGSPSPGAFSVDSAALILPPGATGEIGLTFTPTDWLTVSGTLPLLVDGPVCGSTILSLRGKGTKGVVLVSPGKLDFGAVDCGTTAPPKTIKVANLGDAPFEFTSDLSPDLPMKYVPMSGTVEPGTSIDIVVSPSTIPRSPNSLT